MSKKLSIVLWQYTGRQSCGDQRLCGAAKGTDRRSGCFQSILGSVPTPSARNPTCSRDLPFCCLRLCALTLIVSRYILIVSSAACPKPRHRPAARSPHQEASPLPGTDLCGTRTWTLRREARARRSSRARRQGLTATGGGPSGRCLCAPRTPRLLPPRASEFGAARPAVGWLAQGNWALAAQTTPHRGLAVPAHLKELP